MSIRTVSVVMATYNGSRYIIDQLESLNKQTFKPIEIIISDDSSNDDTVELARKFAIGQETKIRIVKNSVRLGFRDNFLRAALLAGGDFIAFCDQDDIWRADKLERCSRFFGKRDVSLITHSATMIDEFSNKIGKFPQKLSGTRVKPPLSYDLWGTFWGFSIVFRRDMMHLYNIDDRFVDYIDRSYPVAHDRWISFLGQMLGSTVEIDEPLVDYRQHQGNLFGASGHANSAPLTNMKDRSLIYIGATLKMLDIMHNIPNETEKLFPMFDKEKCLLFIDAGLKQLRARHEIYATDDRLNALKIYRHLLWEGKYKNIHDGKVRWRSIVRDLKFIASRA